MKYSLNLSSSVYVNRRALYGVYTLLVFLLLALLVMNVANLWRSLKRMSQIEQQRGELIGSGGA